MEHKLNKQKHLNQEARVIIEKGLDQRLPLRTIAFQLGKDPTTIAKEVKKHRFLKPHNEYGSKSNRCALSKDCHKKDICGIYAPVCRRECRFCNQCHRHCSDFKPFDYHCALTDRAPFVCNGCEKKSSCRLDKYYYKSVQAHREYRTILVECRKGLNITEEELIELDETVSPLILQGQSFYMILKNHPEIPQCEKTLYNYADWGALSIGNIDLSKKVKYKPRKVHGDNEICDSSIYEGRTFKDFTLFISENPDTPVTEMDTVYGCDGSRKVLLTLHFCSGNFMVAFLLNSREAKWVEAVFNSINKAIGSKIFRTVLPVILTDRGSEFKHPDALECSLDNDIRTRIFYCDPMCSWQKPHCEKNHEYIRKICPKGSSFDNLTQADVNLIMSHVNSSCRESLGGQTPFAIAKLTLPKKLLDFFGLKEIPPDEVILTPDLLKRKQIPKK